MPRTTRNRVRDGLRDGVGRAAHPDVWSGLPFALAALLLALPAAVAAQQGCQFVEGSGNLQTVDVGNGSVTYVGTPNLSCRDGVRIRADSAVAFQASNYVQLIGHVRFEDPDRRLTAQNAEYFTTVGRLQAHIGTQLVQKSDGTTVTGAEMVYNRADKDRPRAQLEVFGDRPHALLHVRPRPDSTGAVPDSAGPPYDVVGDRILITEDSTFHARGSVEITRNDLHAFADSVEYDQIGGGLTLMSQARMKIEERDLTADQITAQMPGDEVREVVARRHAVLTSEDIRLTAPLMHVFFEEGAMQRLVATPIAPPPAPRVQLPGGAPAPTSPGGAPGAARISPTPVPAAPAPTVPPPQAPLSEDDKARPVATSEDFTIVADSLDVRAPGEVLDRIHAVGHSHAESSARDSLNQPDTPKIARTDWIEGDTIVAQFVPASLDSTATPPPPAPLVGAADTARADTARARYRIDRLTATGKARTLYRLEPGDSARARGDRHPAIHYVTATSIVLQWDKGEIKNMEVKGQTEGVHIEPAPHVDSTRADSARARPDSTRGAPPRAGTRQEASVLEAPDGPVAPRAARAADASGALGASGPRSSPRRRPSARGSADRRGSRPRPPAHGALARFALGRIGFAHGGRA